MQYPRENSVSFKAGVLSVGVHVTLLAMLLISFNWKTTHPVNVTNVELWDALPAIETPKPLPTPEPVEEPQPVVKEPVVEQEVKPEPIPQAEIVIKKLPEKPVKEKPTDTKRSDALAALQKELMQDEMKKPDKPVSSDALKKLQQEALSEDKAAANAGAIGEFTNKIKAKIRGNVNKTLCGDGNPELKFEIGLLPTGELSAHPKLLKSSGNPACDDAVERAIITSEPLPLPTDPALFAQFRNLKLTFKPNDS